MQNIILCIFYIINVYTYTFVWIYQYAYVLNVYVNKLIYDIEQYVFSIKYVF